MKSVTCIEKIPVPSWSSEKFMSLCCEDDTSLLNNWKLAAEENDCGREEVLRLRDIEKIINALPTTEEDKESKNEHQNLTRKPRNAAEIKEKINDLSSQNEMIQNNIKLKGEEIRQIARAIENTSCNLAKLDDNQGQLTQQFMCDKQAFDDALQSYLQDHNYSEVIAHKVHDANMEIINLGNFLASLKLEEDELDKALQKKEYNFQKNELLHQIRLLQDECSAMEQKMNIINIDAKTINIGIDEKEMKLTKTKDEQAKACQCKIQTQKKKLELEQDLQEVCHELQEQCSSIKEMKESTKENSGIFADLKKRAMESSCCLDSVTKQIIRKQNECDQLMQSVCSAEHKIRDCSSRCSKNEATIEAFEKLKEQIQCQIEEENKKNVELARRNKEYEELLKQNRQKENAMEKNQIKQQLGSFRKC